MKGSYHKTLKMIKLIKITAVICLVTFCSTLYGQSNDHHGRIGNQSAEREIQSALNSKTQPNVIKSGTVIIKDSSTAVAVAEPILFGIYGKANIIKERPYKIHHAGGYWMLEGTLPSGMHGGTFSIILSDKNAQVIEIIHGK